MQAQVEETDSIDSPKVYAAAGIGNEYQGFGAKVSYQLSDKTAAYVSLGVWGLVSTTPALGLEHYFLTQSAGRRFSPYVFGHIDRSIRYTAITEERDMFFNAPLHSEDTFVLSYTLGVGASYLFPSNMGRLNLGLTYSEAFDSNRLEDFAWEYFEELDAEFTVVANRSSTSRIFLTIG